MAPASISFCSTAADKDADPGSIAVEPAAVKAVRPGDILRFEDARGRKRSLRVRMVTESGFACTSDRTGYVTSGMQFQVVRGGKKVLSARVGRVAAKEQAIELKPGDSLIVTSDAIPGRPALCDGERVLEPARIGCSLPDVFAAVKAGERVMFDDGKFEGMVREVRPDQFRVELYRAGAGTAKLRAGKGINLPDTHLELDALTEKDIEDLRFIVGHADMVSLSFVHQPSDVLHLEDELEHLDAGEIGIVLKIENRESFENLPRILLTALRRPPVAVMVARGDLAVEVGFERLAEVQEEILWLCGAAHVPVIWATQVLESLAKNGVPSRAEVTDAAMSTRAECVMLNKGPYMNETIRYLADVCQRMSRHWVKRVATLRKLNVADEFSLGRDADDNA